MLITVTRKLILTVSIELSKESKQMTRQYLVNLICSQNIEVSAQTGLILLSRVLKATKTIYG